MQNNNCTEFLQWCLPKLHMRWAGFRKVRNQVCKRINRRLQEIKISDYSNYKNYLDSHPEEWHILDSLCRISISRFYRDKGVWDILHSGIMPTLCDNITDKKELHAWSLGCCSGEEAYTLNIIWELGVHLLSKSIEFKMTATDSDINLLNRARTGCYKLSSLKDLPSRYFKKAFRNSGGMYFILDSFKQNIQFIRQDIREQLPEGAFHLVFCRNLVFTYFDKTLQSEILKRIVEKLLPGGYLTIGKHESLPECDLIPYKKSGCIYQKLI